MRDDADDRLTIKTNTAGYQDLFTLTFKGPALAKCSCQEDAVKLI